MCIAVGFPRQDKIAAENSRRRIDLLIYRRFGAPDEVIDRLWQAAEVTGLFIPAGRELKS